MNMANFVLRPTKQKKIMRGLLLASPIFLFHPLMQVVQSILVPGLPPVSYGFQLWIVGAPYLFSAALVACYFERYRIKNGVLEFGLLGLNKVPLSRITEVAGDEGYLGNDFEESILLKLDNEDKKGLVLPVREFDEHELRLFLSTLKDENPAGNYTYSDVIPFESRGLIRFLFNINEADSLVIKLSRSPMEDAIVQVVKGHEKTFWIVYLAVWMMVLFGLSYYCMLFNAEWSLHPGVNPQWNASEATRQLAGNLLAAEKGGAPFWEIMALRASMGTQISLDYLQGGLTGLTACWLFAGFLTLVLIPLIKIYSSTYFFIDAKSVGMGSTFLTWDVIHSVALYKSGPLADPLDGRLEILSTGGRRVDVDLSRVNDPQTRRQILRLIDRYAEDAAFNNELMRTSNTLFDIQFTDLWLEDQGSSPKQQVNSELTSLCNDAYQITSLLGYGGQGVTYLANTEGRTIDGGEVIPKGEVVIKELVLPNYADVRIMHDATSRFERGARLLKDLKHHQVVMLLDYFLENGKAYLVMEYVRGKSLREMINENGALSLERAKELGAQLCEILTFLHERETPVIHCDFAPDNLIVTPDGGIKLLDFDVARVVDSKAHTFIAGRPSYTPPEQFRGHPTIKSDIFALGAILHFLVTGNDPQPLCAGTFDESQPELPGEIEELIRSCCQFEEESRPASATIVKERLESMSETQVNKISLAVRVPETN